METAAIRKGSQSADTVGSGPLAAGERARYERLKRMFSVAVSQEKLAAVAEMCYCADPAA